MDINIEYCRQILKKRSPYTSKTDYGHLLLVCGSKTMPGAAMLATGAALRSGCGLVTLHSVENVCNAVSFNFPSAILSFDDNNETISGFIENFSKYDVVAVGPGIGRSVTTRKAFLELVSKCNVLGKRMLLDADALNILSGNREWLSLIPDGSVLTPHDRELARLCDISDKLDAVKTLSRDCNSVVVSKGYKTQIVTPTGEIFVNTSGGPGLAKGGSGDVLAGLIAGLMARGYNTCEAACLGTWIHGYTGDFLSKERSTEAFDSSDLMNTLYKGFVKLADC